MQFLFDCRAINLHINIWKKPAYKVQEWHFKVFGDSFQHSVACSWGDLGMLAAIFNVSIWNALFRVLWILKKIVLYI